MQQSTRISNKEIRSHVQMPKLLLKRFQNKKHRFFYYDIRKNFIGTNGTAESLNTERGYFSPEMEQYLSQNIETPFGKILSVIDRIDFEQECFLMPADFENLTKTFVYALMARDPHEIEDANRDMFFSQILFPKQTRHDCLTLRRIKIASKRDFLSGYLLTFMLNETDVPFVLPISGIYGYQMGKYRINSLPVTPKIALCFVHIDDAEDLIVGENKTSLLKVTNPTMIRKINEKAFKAQINRNHGWLICPYREELDRLKEKTPKYFKTDQEI